MESLLDAATTNEGQPTPTPPADAGGAPASSEQTGEEGQHTPPETTETTTETSQDGDGEGAAKKAEGDKPDGDAEPDKPKPPDKYELKLGEEPIESESYATVARELGLSQEAAQKVLDSLAPSLEERVLSKQTTTLQAKVRAWSEEARNHAEFGGDQFNANMALVKRGLSIPGGEKLAQLLKATGFGNKVEVLQYVAAVGSIVSPDTKVPRGKTGAADESMDPIDRLARTYETT